MKKYIIIVVYRLRKESELEKIVKKLEENDYVKYYYKIEDKNNIELDMVEKELQKLNIFDDKRSSIVFISNIKDLLMYSYRKYNNYIDNWIYFIDNYNYEIIKKDNNLERKVSEFYGVEVENISKKIYININYNNIDNISNLLIVNYNFRFFKPIEEIELKKNSLKKLESKEYYFDENKLHLKVKDSLGIKIVYNQEDISKNLWKYLEDNFWFIPIYSLYVLRNTDSETSIEILVKYFSYIQIYTKENKTLIMNYLLNYEDFEELDIKKKFSLISLIALMEPCDEKLSERIALEIEKDNNKNANLYYGIISNMITYISYHNLYTTPFYYRKLSEIMEKLEVDYNSSIKQNEKQNIVVIMVDRLNTIFQSDVKLVIDLANNMLKNSKYKPIIVIEDNFNIREEDNFMAYSLLRGMESSLQYKEIHTIELKDVEIIYSNINIDKKERDRETIENILKINPIAILTTTVNSFTVNELYKKTPMIYLSLGGVNLTNKFHLQLFPHIESAIEIYKNCGYENNWIKENLFKINYGADFIESDKICDKSKYLINETDFVMVTVGVRLKHEITKEFTDYICAFIEKYKEAKWYIIGETDFPYIKNKYAKYLNKTIFLIEFEEKLGEFYRACSVYLNPQRVGGGFSIVEAVVNGVAIVSTETSDAGFHYIGKENCVKDMKDYMLEMEKLLDKNYREKQVESEKKQVERYSYKKTVEELEIYIEKAINIFENRE